jgi:hydroxymethylpyrimidine pyrophosphatase-like HAD family hydrolase
MNNISTVLIVILALTGTPAISKEMLPRTPEAALADTLIAKEKAAWQLYKDKDAAGLKAITADDFSDLYDRADKITFVSDDPPVLKDLAARGVAQFGARATIGQSQTYYLDVTDTHANKGDGVAELAAILGVDLAHVAVFGDMDNDVAMFARAGMSVAMGQAPDTVKSAADFVSTSNEQDGVAHAIDAFVLAKAAA